MKTVHVDDEPHYTRALAIALRVVAAPQPQQAELLKEICGDNETLRHEVEWLLDATEENKDAPPPSLNAIENRLNRSIRPTHVESTSVDRYRLIERLGEGGMGVVWLAEREVRGVTQRVALKSLRPGTTAGYAHFHAEQRILTNLNHPNIARLIDAGDDASGSPFLAMEYVHGERIDRWCKTHDLDLRARIRLFLKVCSAVSYAHERLIIHRDIKPANILVDHDGEPKLLDFGIARLLDNESSYSPATRVMTPGYASPEQIEGTPLGTATDIWSLGIVLYELIAGVQPFSHFATEQARNHAILNGIVHPPSFKQQKHAKTLSPKKTRHQKIPADIDAIILKALRREPAERYNSVRALSDDLDAFLTSRPVSARRGQWFYFARRFIERNRWALTAAAAVMLLILGFTWRTYEAEQVAKLNAEVADQTTQLLISAFALSDPTQADRHDFTAREVLDLGLNRVNTELLNQPRARAQILEALGTAYLGINEGKAGNDLFEEAAILNLSKEVNAPLSAARNLQKQSEAIINNNGQGYYAEKVAQEAYDLVKKHAPNDKLLLAQAHGMLAIALDYNGKESLAITHAHTALNLRQEANASAQLIARSHYEICRTQAGNARYQDALHWCQSAVSKFRELDDKDPRDYFKSLGFLGSTYSYLGMTEESLKTEGEIASLIRQRYGENSPALAMQMLKMSMSHVEMGRFNQAKENLAAGLPIIKNLKETSPSQYAHGLFYDGWVDFNLGLFETAIPKLRQSLYTMSPAVAANDQQYNGSITILQTTLATAIISSGAPTEEARQHLELAIQSLSAADENATGLPYARLPLANWHILSGNYEEASSLLDLVDSAADRVEPKIRAQSAAARGAIYLAQNNLAESVKLERLAFEITRDAQGVNNPITARFAINLASRLELNGEYEEAESLRRFYTPIVSDNYPRESAYRTALAPQTPVIQNKVKI